MLDHAPILPGATVGVLGSGQLGRMFAIAARRMGYRVHTYSSKEDTPTGQVSDREVNASFDDHDRLRDFASKVDVVTFEFENVPSAAVEVVSAHAPVRPGGHVLHTTQHRLREKEFLARHGFPVVPFRHIRTAPELNTALAELGMPAVLKTAGFGYDGKGQVKIAGEADVAPALEMLEGQESVLEAFIAFECEVSVVAARSLDGAFAHYGAVGNEHRNHILDITRAPADVSPRTAEAAVEIARAVLEKLDVVGVMCVEYFVVGDGELIINELAPRPHNSGHFSFDANVTSQFEQQLRAVCGLPLGSTEQMRPAAMANLLGDLWQNGEPNWAAACAFPEVKLHLYGKSTPAPGRKMGHLTALAADAATAVRTVQAARAALG